VGARELARHVQVHSQIRQVVDQRGDPRVELLLALTLPCVRHDNLRDGVVTIRRQVGMLPRGAAPKFFHDSSTIWAESRGLQATAGDKLRSRKPYDDVWIGEFACVVAGSRVHCDFVFESLWGRH
jgi:hypothetical protein